MRMPTAVSDEEILSDKLDRNLGRRRRDLSILVLDWRSHQRDSPIEKHARRLVIVFLYAHWEGFIRDAAHAYVKFVVGQGASVGDLSAPFRAIASRGRILASAGAKKSSAHAQLISDLDQMLAAPFSSYAKSCIDTESNLSSVVFREILETVGVRYLTAYELFARRLDANLVNERNAIAHGELKEPDYDETNALVDEVWKKLQSVKRQIEESVRRRAYLLQP